MTLVAYSTPREAYAELIPLFQATAAGQGVTFEESYAGSGDQSRAVQAGLPADVLALALSPDVERLVEPGIVAEDWDENPYKGIIHNSVVVFDVRPGNPKNIQTWDDLIREDVSVITPNPITSGGAQWNILAAYQAQIDAGKTEEEAIDFLNQLAARVVVWDPSARDALNTFLQAGQGDVLIGYENEAIFAQQAGQPLEYVVPDSTLLIENAIATTLGRRRTRACRRPSSTSLYTPEAQTHLRPARLPARARGSGAPVPGLPTADQPRHGRRRPGRLGRGSSQVLRSRGRDHGRDLRRPGHRELSECGERPAASAAGRHRQLRRPGPAGPRPRRAVPGAHRPHPDRGALLAVASA